MSITFMKRKSKRNAQLAVVLLGALALKLFYSTASVNHLRWILAPTALLVEIATGRSFAFESHAGYMSGDGSFVIAASCAGVNFLLTSFLMLSLSKLWRNRSGKLPWRFIPAAVLFAYMATILANTVRIATALRLQRTPLEVNWLNPNQLHRFEGIFIYFGFLLLLFMISEKMSAKGEAVRTADAVSRGWATGLFRQSIFPLLIYYATMLGIPLLNGAYRPGTVGTDFWEHLLFVLLTPLLLILPLATFHLFRMERDQRQRRSFGPLRRGFR